MDTIKIGKFISAMRKEQGFTQRSFADILGISDKTVSKWERGNGMPELSLMPPLCSALKINLNELFSGERLDDTRYKKNAEENMLCLLREAEKIKKNIVGGRALGEAQNVHLNANSVHKTNREFWSGTGSEALGVTVLPNYGGYMTEKKLNLLGDLSGKRVLEIGCGHGGSLKYAKDCGASELWGIDISPEQLDRAQEFLSSQNVRANLICSPMENACGIPTDYFDTVYSVFGIGWTTDLDATCTRINACLKPGGAFIFSWSHPIHKCTLFEDGKLFFSNSYFDESWYSAAICNQEFMLSNRMMSTYVNALAGNGFMIETLIEAGDDDLRNADIGTFSDKAKIVPVGFVIKARKIR